MSSSFNIERSDCEHTTVLPVQSWFTSSSKLKFLLSREQRASISWERGAFSEQSTGLPVPSWFGFGFGFGLVGWELFACRATSEPNSFIQSCFKEIFGGGQRWRTYFLVYDFSSFHPNNFRDTISWECCVKNDGVRCLIEFQSFLQSKIDVDPIHRVLMFLPCFMHVLCNTRCSQVDPVRLLVFLVRRIHKQKEYCLSVCSNFVLPVSILNWWWNVNSSHILHDECTWRNRPEQWHCPVMKDQ